MKLIDIINNMDENTKICVEKRIYGTKFVTEHYAEYYLDLEDDLLEMKVKGIRVSDNKLYLSLD